MVTKYSISVTQGTGNRALRGSYKTKEEAKKALKNLNSRTDADTRNPRIVKYKGFK